MTAQEAFSRDSTVSSASNRHTIVSNTTYISLSFLVIDFLIKNNNAALTPSRPAPDSVFTCQPLRTIPDRAENP